MGSWEKSPEGLRWVGLIWEFKRSSRNERENFLEDRSLTQKDLASPRGETPAGVLVGKIPAQGRCATPSAAHLPAGLGASSSASSFRTPRWAHHHPNLTSGRRIIIRILIRRCASSSASSSVSAAPAPRPASAPGSQPASREPLHVQPSKVGMLHVQRLPPRQSIPARS